MRCFALDGTISHICCGKFVASPPRKTAQKSHYRAEYRAIYETRREVRLEAGLTQTDLAEQLGRSQNFVSQAELGYKRLDGLQLMDWVDRSG
jgi:DNA-binding XRE family transcriptional regulator